MKLEDALSIFDFLAKLDWLSLIGVIIASALLSGYFIASITEKLFDDESTRRRIIVATIVLVIFCICFLTVDARRKMTTLNRANDVKQWMLEFENETSGYIELSNRVSFPDHKSTDDRIDELKDLVRQFPEEFSETRINSSEFKNDTLGIVLVNPKTVAILNRRNADLYPYYKTKLLYNMRLCDCDTLNYKFIRDNIDIRLSNYVLDMLISRNPKLFIPIYAPYNNDPGDTLHHSKRGTSALRLNPDSVPGNWANIKQ